MTRLKEPELARKFKTEWIFLPLILLAAVFFRLWRLDSVPPGLTHDEANNVHDAAAVLDGVRPFYFPVAQGKEPLYPYSVAGLMALLGRSPWVMRLTSVIWGLLLLAVSYAWARRAFDPAVALCTAAGLAVSFWPVSTARMGLRAIALPALFAASAHLFWLGKGERATRDSLRYFLLAGLALGSSLYSYLASQLMPFVPALFIVYLLLFQRDRWRQAWKGVALALLVAAAVAAPLFLYLNAHPAAAIRIGQLDRPLRVLLEGGDPKLLLERIGEAVTIFSFRGDTFLPYNIPGKPLLDPVMSVLFYAGLLLALWRWRRPAYFFALLWLGVGLAPVMVTGLEAGNLRAIAAQPVVYLFPALSLVTGGRLVASSTAFRKQLDERALVAGGILLYAAVAGFTYRDYFIRWAQDRDVRVHYHADLIAIAENIRLHPDMVTAVSALYPGQYHDPRVVEAELEGDLRNSRWFDGHSSLLIPSGEEARILIPANAPLDPALAQIAELELVERVLIRPDDLTPSFDLYQGQVIPLMTDELLASFGDSLRLLSAELAPGRPATGEIVQLLTFWQVSGELPAERDAVIFAQLLGDDGQVVAQEDRLDVPSWNWQVNDRFVQLLRLTLPPDLPPGAYRLILGVYTVPDRVDAVLAGGEPDPATPRLPVLIDGHPAGDHVELPAVEVVHDGS